MNKYLRWIRLAMPFVNLAAEELKINKSAKAIKIVAAIKYVDSILNAVVNNLEIPDAPKELTTPVVPEIIK